MVVGWGYFLLWASRCLKMGDKQEISTVNEENNMDIEAGRYDDFGRLVKNIEDMPELYTSLMTKYQSEKKMSPSAVILRIKIEDNPRRSDVYACFKLMNIDSSDARVIFREGAKTFYIDFVSLDVKKLAISQVTKFFSDKYDMWSCVQDVTQVTVGGLPIHFEDTDVLGFLGHFGDFNDNLDEVIHKYDKYGSHMGERVYTAKSIAVDIPSYWYIYGHQISFRYPKQPHTCRICGKRGHQASDCPDSNHNRGRQIQVHMESSDVHNETTVSNTESSNNRYSGRSRGNYSGRLKKTWADGGYSPQGGKPQYVGNDGDGQVSLRPGMATLGDYVSKAQDNMIRLKRGNKMRRVVVGAKTKAQIQHEQLINDVNDKLAHVQSVIVDDKFTDEENKNVAIDVHQALVDVKKLADVDKTEEEYQPPVDGSPEAIQRLIDYDIQLLSNCAQRIGAPCGARLKSPAFQRIIKNFIGNLESRKRAADAEISISSEEQQKENE